MEFLKKHKLFVGIFGIYGSITIAGPAENLNSARALLEAGKHEEANEAYAAIEFDDEQWQDKVVDWMRHHIIQKNPREAYRIIEMARTTRLDIPEITYYRALTRTLARGCPLELDIEPYEWKLLIAAHTYRFGSRFASRRYDASPFSEAGYGPLQHHLAQSQFHNLIDIPNVKLVPSGGCWLYEKRLSQIKMRDKYEFEALKDWNDIMEKKPKTERLSGHLAVKLRLLVLAGKLEQKQIEQELIDDYKNLDKSDWLGLKEPERSYIYNRLIVLEEIPPPPYSNKSKPFDTVMHVVKNSRADIASLWAGLLDFHSMERADQSALLDFLLDLEGISSKPHLLYLRAKNDYLDGKIYQVLRRIRSIYKVQVGGTDIVLDEYIALLMIDIFAEYRYDKGMLGAIHAALPHSLWMRIIRPIMLDDALTGNRRGYDLVKKELSNKRSLNALRFGKDQIEMMDSLARRQGKTFATIHKALRSKRRLSQRWIQFFRALGERVVARGDRSIDYKKYLVEIAKTLEEFIGKGINIETLRELLAIYDPFNESRYGQGQATVRGQSVNVGSVRIDERRPIAFPFSWIPPTDLEKQDLLVVPELTTNRAWAIR